MCTQKHPRKFNNTRDSTDFSVNNICQEQFDCNTQKAIDLMKHRGVLWNKKIKKNVLWKSHKFLLSLFYSYGFLCTFIFSFLFRWSTSAVVHGPCFPPQLINTVVQQGSSLSYTINLLCIGETLSISRLVKILLCITQNHLKEDPSNINYSWFYVEGWVTFDVRSFYYFWFGQKNLCLLQCLKIPHKLFNT